MADDLSTHPSPEATRILARIEATRTDVDNLANDVGSQEAADTANTLHRLLTFAEEQAEEHARVDPDRAVGDRCDRCLDRHPCAYLQRLARVWPDQ